MHKIILFLAMYFLGLAFVPCADEGIDIAEKKIEVKTQHTDHHHDVCSTICACSCCGVTSNVQHLSTFVFDLKTTHKALLITQITQRFQGFRLSVWQPPKFEYYS